jgi:hypothetical protein
MRRHSLTHSLALAVTFASVSIAQSANEPRLPYSTHDYTTTTDDSVLPEVWADVKSPGSGRTYLVGTIEIVEASSSSKFSFEDVDLPPSTAQPFNGSTNRQVVILQAVNDDQTIAWQRYFYGHTSGGEFDFPVGTNARAVSVWHAYDEYGALDEAATRIAICGETYDRELPLSQAGTLSAWSSTSPTGFIAVYDGEGDLLWTHHFHGTDSAGDCAITDISIRVESRDSQLTDIVTYCGISSHAVPGSTTPLSPVEPFAPLLTCTAGVGGNTANGTAGNQWDGIVGRLVRSQASMSTTTTEFHSIVGGTAQDGLFGITELDTERFLVVGTTADDGTTASSFPLISTCLDGIANYCVGVTMLFDATDVTAGTGVLQLHNSVHLGTVDPDAHTAARDVVAVPDVESGLAYFHLVGSTDDPDFLTTTASNGFQSTHGGGRDGFVVTGLDQIFGFTFQHASFFGGTNDQGLTGVAAWPEFPDHLVFVGFDMASANGEVTVGSVFRDTTLATPQLLLLRSSNTGGTMADLPTQMGAKQAMVIGLTYDDHNLGSPAGGGIAMNPSGRANAVGSTVSSDYPVSIPPYTGRPFQSDVDAIRTTFDMLPEGVSRTDGTGTYAGNVTLTLPTSWDGGTTPLACLTPYGLRVGSPNPDAKRMLVDYEGPAPAAYLSTAAILVDRPHIDAFNLIGAVVDVGFPSALPTMLNQMETWLNPSTATNYLIPWTTGLEESLRWPIATMPSPSLTFTLQFFVFLQSPQSCNGNNLQTIASPAVTIDY